MSKKLIVNLTFIFLLFDTAFAQQSNMKIWGKVVDGYGLSIPNVIINSNIGGLPKYSNYKGEFEADVVKNTTLSFYHIGYQIKSTKITQPGFYLITIEKQLTNSEIKVEIPKDRLLEVPKFSSVVESEVKDTYEIVKIPAQFIKDFPQFLKNEVYKFLNSNKNLKVMPHYVHVDFSILKDGQVVWVKPNVSTEDTIDKKIVEIIKESPRYWIPAIQNGNAINTQHSLKIEFVPLGNANNSNENKAELEESAFVDTFTSSINKTPQRPNKYTNGPITFKVDTTNLPLNEKSKAITKLIEQYDFFPTFFELFKNFSNEKDAEKYFNKFKPDYLVEFKPTLDRVVINKMYKKFSLSEINYLIKAQKTNNNGNNEFINSIFLSEVFVILGTFYQNDMKNRF